MKWSRTILIPYSYYNVIASHIWMIAFTMVYHLRYFAFQLARHILIDIPQHQSDHSCMHNAVEYHRPNIQKNMKIKYILHFIRLAEKSQQLDALTIGLILSSTPNCSNTSICWIKILSAAKWSKVHSPANYSSNNYQGKIRTKQIWTKSIKY